MSGALDGIRVLDLCIILAGPTCGRTLAEYGAEVIKIDAWHRPPNSKQPHDVGRGKKSICLDLTKQAGLDVFFQLVETADVVLGGFRKGVAERMGLGYDQLKARKPDIVYALINAFGQDGPWAGRPGYEQNAQAATGVQVRNAGRGEKPIHSPYTFNDYGTGLMTAYGVMLALLERKRTGRGQIVHTSIVQTGSTFSSPFLIDHQGYQRSEVEGLDAKGLDALTRLYETTDGWIVIAEADWSALTGLEPFAHLSHRPEFSSEQLRAQNDDGLSSELASIFKLRPTKDWLEALNSVGISAIQNATLSDIFDDEYPRNQELIVTEDVPGYGSVTHGGIAIRLSKTPQKLGSAPVFGEDTEAILLELGYSVEEIDALREDEVIPPLE